MRHDLNNITEGQKIIDYALSNDINYFETCYFYLNHQCEEYVYDLLSPYSRSAYSICGKLSLSEGFERSDFTYKDLYYKQLKRVPKHYFDYYILQTFRPYAYNQVMGTDMLDFFQEEKKKGNIGSFGFSEQCEAELLKKFLIFDKWDIAQMAFNYYDWFLCDKSTNYSLIAEKGIPIVAQAPFKGGLLIKDFQNNKILQEYYPNRSPAQIAIDFVESKHPNIILLGCSTLETLKKAHKAHQNTNSNFNDEGCRKAIEEYKKKIFIPCILCGKCEFSCPAHINLPLYIGMHNRTLSNSAHFSDLAFLKSTADEPINKCIQCGNCANVCPLHIDIPRRLHDIFELRP